MDGQRRCIGQVLYRVSESKFRLRAKGRDGIESDERYQLRESPAPCEGLFEVENEDIGLGNTHF